MFFVHLFCCFCILEFSSGGEMETTYIKKLFIVVEHYTHINTCYICIVAIVDCTHVHHVAHYQISKHTISCSHCWLLPCRVGYRFLEDMGPLRRTLQLQQIFWSNILIEDQLRPPLEMVTVDKKWELHKKSWNKCQLFVTVQIIKLCSVSRLKPHSLVLLRESIME